MKLLLLLVSYVLLFVGIIDLVITLKIEEPSKRIVFKCFLVCIYFWIVFGITLYCMITGGN